MPNKLIVFATYWNEIDFIRPSLLQIDRLNPEEVSICDGCFDPVVPNYSTDGTREIIEEFVAERSHARMISALRVPKIIGIGKLLRGHNKSSVRRTFTPGRLKSVLLASKLVPYRINQALTFQLMITLSRCWKPGHWFMTLDCDQFYSDEMIDKFKIVNEDTSYGLLVGHEKTFFKDFSSFTDEYEKRSYNNMPHKIYSGTTIIPTRGAIIENWSFSSFRVKEVMLGEFYVRKVPTLDIGSYCHYKFKLSDERFETGYRLGDRKMPDTDGYLLKRMTSRHPAPIKEFFNTGE
jgi:hypothetical protein